jgi:NAD+ diphosphatase
MIGFVAQYAGGEVVVDREELEDARWFPCNALPVTPSRHSIAGWIMRNFTH